MAKKKYEKPEIKTKPVIEVDTVYDFGGVSLVRKLVTMLREIEQE